MGQQSIWVIIVRVHHPDTCGAFTVGLVSYIEV